MWAGPLQDRSFVERLQKTVNSLDSSVYVTKARMQGVLSLVEEVLSLIDYADSGIGCTILSDTTMVVKYDEIGDPAP
jgi:tRNA G26 N,N-dimethylase Trm1